MMDRDQATLTARFDAQDRLLRALSVTQSDHTARLTRVEEILGRHSEVLGSHSEILSRHSEALDLVQAGIRDILTLLQNGGAAGGQGKLGG